MMYSPPIPDPYVHHNGVYWPNTQWWSDIVEDLKRNYFFNSNAVKFITPEKKMIRNSLLDQIQKNSQKKEMDIERIKKYTQTLKELEEKLNAIKPLLLEKQVDLDAAIQKVNEGFMHPGVQRSMEYGIKMAQLFGGDNDIPGKVDALKAMSLSYILSEKYNEWEKVAYQYYSIKVQLDALKRNYADLKDTLVEALKCFDDAVDNTEKTE